MHSLRHRVLKYLLGPMILGACLGGAWAATASATTQITLGVNAEEIDTNTASALESFGSTAGVMPRIAMWYQDWTESWSTALINPKFVNPTTQLGAVPMITWQPDLDTGNPTNQPAYTPADIAAGRYDAFIRRAALETAAYKKPVFIRLAPEMNGSWFPWGAKINGNTPASYISMWRHVVSIFRSVGATNAKWVWSPNVNCSGTCPFPAYYPGNSWVDWVALDGYNYASVDKTAWMSFEQLFQKSYDILAGMTSKPMMIAETSSTELGGDKAAWIESIPHVITTVMPRVRALIWFDRVKETDWRINSSAASLAAFRNVAQSGFFSAPLSSLLESGT